jgi:predicted 3-demethylubiquinone-9 3-methyltransferase (glyoxalase superfamily)
MACQMTSVRCRFGQYRRFRHRRDDRTRAGWLDDRFGLSWQIVPTVLIELVSDPTRRRPGASPVH